MLLQLLRCAPRLLASLSSVLPCSCALCGRDGPTAVCRDCDNQFFRAVRIRCTRCAIPLASKESASVCGKCLGSPPAFDSTVVVADYAPPLDQLVLGLKFAGRLELAPLIAAKLEQALAQVPDDLRPSILTAVPLGDRRLAERGFNQAAEIARPLSRSLGMQLDLGLVVRQRETNAQALLHLSERHRNVRRAFAVPASAADRVRGHHIGVLDDVMTTGETLNEIAATLKRMGAIRVTNLVFARTE